MDIDEILAAFQGGGAFYSRADGHDGLIAVSGQVYERLVIAVFRHVTDSDVGWAAVHALADARACGYERVSVQDAAAALRFHESDIVYSNYSSEEDIRELAQEIAQAKDVRRDLGAVGDYLDAIERLRAFEGEEYGYVFDPDDDLLDYLHGDYANLTRLPVAERYLDSPLVPDSVQSVGMFKVEVSCDLVHAELVTDVSWFKPVVERFDDLATMKDKLLDTMDFDQLTDWSDAIESALHGHDDRLKFRYEGTRKALTNADMPVYHVFEMVRPARQLPFSGQTVPLIFDDRTEEIF